MTGATDHRPEPADEPAASAGHRRGLAREFFASALYVAIALLAALVALPRDSLPEDAAVAGILLGTATGLVLAHFVAFRLAAHLTSQTGFAPAEVAQEAAAGLAGGLLAGAVAAVPFLIWDGDDALAGTFVALVGLPALMGLAIARVRGSSWPVSLLAAGIAVSLALVAVLIKAALGH